MPDPFEEFAKKHRLSDEARADLATLTGLLRDPEPGVPERVAQASGLPESGDRYELVKLLGMGAMGEVYRARDRVLGRVVALKVIRDHRVSQSSRIRFEQEAHATAQLQHPGVVPLYDMGLMPDGRPFITMRELVGSTFSEHMAAVHWASRDGAWAETRSGWTFKRLVDALSRVCDAVGYAHSRGLIHRDIKPDNIMVGDHGEVLVVDWGLAKAVGVPDGPAIDLNPASQPRGATRMGSAAGTPAYMAPEQARGEIDRLGPWSDVYALGCVLHELIYGLVPSQVDDEGPSAGRSRVRLPEPPGALVSLCARALEYEPERRPPSASVLGSELKAWLDGVRRRERALMLVGEAQAAASGIRELRQQASGLRTESREGLSAVASWAGEEAKTEWWDLEDEAERLEDEALRQDMTARLKLESSLAFSRHLPEAHAALAERSRAEQAEHEAQGRLPEARRAEQRLRVHVASLSPSHPLHGELNEWLRGDGALSLELDRPAEVEILRYEPHHRRLVPKSVARLVAPVREYTLPMGSYLARVRSEGVPPLALPFRIARVEHWRAQLSVPARIPPGTCLVPEGWFLSGGDPHHGETLPRRSVWLDAFFIDAFPVTNRRYLEFLHALTGEEAEQHVPRTRDGQALYSRTAGGSWELQVDPWGVQWLPDHPVVMVTWHDAERFAAWRASLSGEPWSLPGELAWEKAARGVDGRPYPWGHHVDPAWTAMLGSFEGRPQPPEVDSFPVDVSPYGVRGMAGNVRDWCADRYRWEGPDVVEGRAELVPRAEPGVGEGARRVARGGFVFGTGRQCRCDLRSSVEPNARYATLGFRLMRGV